MGMQQVHELGPAKSPLRGVVARLAGRHGLVEGRGAGVGQVVAGRILDDAVEAVGEEHALAERVAQCQDVDVLRAGGVPSSRGRGCNTAGCLRWPCAASHLWQLHTPSPFQVMT